MTDDEWSERRLSRFLSLVLRHRPERVGVHLDAGGWAEVKELFHGTARRSLPAIRRDGLTGRGRNHVHLSGDPGTATTVGRRHGDPVILTVAAGELHH